METTKNIYNAFRLVKNIAILVILFSFTFVGVIYYMSEQKVNRSREKIYVLTNSDALEFALSKNPEINRKAEIKNHLELFNRLFFEFDPDPKEINDSVDRALVLIDNSGTQMHSSRKESLYYHKIVEGNISSRIKMDSVKIDVSNYPYQSIVYGKQRLIRPSAIVYKNFIARCQLRDVKRTDDNPHGLYIEKYKLINNKTIDEQARN